MVKFFPVRTVRVRRLPPANEVQAATTPANTSSSSQRDGARRQLLRWPQRAARRPTSPTTELCTAPPHAGRQVHRACLRRDEGEGDPAPRRPFGSFFLREDSSTSPSCCSPSGTGFCAHQASSSNTPGVRRPSRGRRSTGVCRNKPIATRTTGPRAAAARLPNPALRRCFRAEARRRLEGAHGLRAPGRDGRYRLDSPAIGSMPAARIMVESAQKIFSLAAACPRTSSTQGFTSEADKHGAQA